MWPTKGELSHGAWEMPGSRRERGRRTWSRVTSSLGLTHRQEIWSTSDTMQVCPWG